MATQATDKSNEYYDPGYDYLKYWRGREYEHQAEVLAIKRLLEGKHFKTAVDVGGGYGRLSVLLEDYADKVTLAEPSQQQLDTSKEFLEDRPEITRKLMSANDLKFDDGSVGLITMIRVMHHLPNPNAEFAEIARVLAPDGYAVIEAANYMHVRNRVKHLLKRQKMPDKPVDIRSPENRKKGDIQFVNHNPHTVMKQLADAGLHVERILSVSNLRSNNLKKLMPTKVLLAVEGVLQPRLSKTFFGPSIFFFVRKTKV